MSAETALKEQAAWLAMNSVSKEARAFACAVTDYLAAPQPVTAEREQAGFKMALVVKHRLLRKEGTDWLPASEFLTGPPDAVWEELTNASPESWRIEYSERVTGQQIQDGLTKAFSSWRDDIDASLAPQQASATPTPPAALAAPLTVIEQMREAVEQWWPAGPQTLQEKLKEILDAASPAPADAGEPDTDEAARQEWVSNIMKSYERHVQERAKGTPQPDRDAVGEALARAVEEFHYLRSQHKHSITDKERWACIEEAARKALAPAPKETK